MTTSTYSVTGMTCGHCANHVHAEVGRLPGVKDVAVDVSQGKVTVVSEDVLDIATVRAAVEEAGYALAS